MTPLVSPAMFREFFAPYYKKVIGGLKAMGVRYFNIDSDGDARLLIAELMKCGVTGIHPCEVNAGMDVEELRKEFPAFILKGGIDKRALARGPEAIDSELGRRMSFAWRSGRYVPYPDHGLPPDISWENVKYYAKQNLQWCASPRGPGYAGR